MDIDTYNTNHNYKFQNMIRAIQRQEILAAFVGTLIVIFVAQLSIGAIKFVGDSNAYWHYSSLILNMDFPKTMRGFFYPLILAFPRFIFETFPATGYLGLYVIQAALFSYTLSIMLPYVFTELIGGKTSLYRRIAPPILVAIFFPGLLAHPLSDLPALCMIIASLYLILKSSQQNNILSPLILLFLAGIMAYGAYNTRTIYLFPLLILVPIIPFVTLKKRTHIENFLFTAIFVSGAAFASLPQIMINIKHLNLPSPFVITDDKKTSLYANQLKWGVTIQRYETGYIPASGAIYPIYYLDPLGERVFEEFGLDQGDISVSKMLTTIINHPITFARIYAKHFINGMDIRDPDPYTTKPSRDRNIRSFASIAVCVLGIFFILLIIARHKAWPETFRSVLWLSLLLLPALAITPGAIETRFFLPLHLIAYCAISFGSSKNIKSELSNGKLLVGAAIYLTLVLSFYTSAKESVQHPTSEIKKEYFY